MSKRLSACKNIERYLAAAIDRINSGDCYPIVDQAGFVRLYCGPEVVDEYGRLADHTAAIACRCLASSLIDCKEV